MSSDSGARLLATFLRAHRENTAPASVGITPVGKRRTPGLRREEVAALAGVGVAWYTWLEQGRVQASKQVLESIGRTLSLGDGSFRYMLEVAGYGRPSTPLPRGAAESDEQTASLIVRSWSLGPALVMDRWFDVIDSNAACSVIWGNEFTETNLMIATATSRRTDELLLGGGRAFLRAHLPRFRAQTAAHLGVARVMKIYEELALRVPEIADWWSCQTMDAPAHVDFVIGLAGRRIEMTQSFLEMPSSGLTVVVQRATDALGAAAIAEALRMAGHPQMQGMTSDHRMSRNLAYVS